jgi:hypothetical protein
MRIRFVKTTDEQHTLELDRGDGHGERVLCETRSCLLHDFLHLAVESEAGLSGGFWGKLAAGTTLAAMNDRMRPATAGDEELIAIERLVGALHAMTKGQTPSEVVAGLRRYAEALETRLPGWLTEELVSRVEERLRRLVGRWKATPYGAKMEVEWPS